MATPFIGAMGFAGLSWISSFQEAQACGNMVYSPRPNQTMQKACGDRASWTLISLGTMFGAFVGVIVGFVMAIFGFIENSVLQANAIANSGALASKDPKRPPPSS